MIPTKDTIRTLREKHAITQMKLAEIMGVTQGAVSQWEKGLTHPKIRLLARLASVLGTTVDELVKESN